MSKSFINFPSFDGTWRQPSIASIRTATSITLTRAGTPTLVHIRTPPSRSLRFCGRVPSEANSLPLDSSASALRCHRPSTHASVASHVRRTRGRAQSDTSPYNLLPPDLVSEEVGRPISAVLVSFNPIEWAGENEPHPGTPATVDTFVDDGEDKEAVSPKGSLPAALARLFTGAGEREAAGVRAGSEVSNVSAPEGSNTSSGVRSIVIVEPLRLGKGKQRRETSVVAVKSPYLWRRRDVKEKVAEGVKGIVRKVKGKFAR